MKKTINRGSLTGKKLFCNCRTHNGLTVIELVGVLTILAILLSMIVGSFLGWGRLGAIDGGVNIFVTGLSHARELAINQRETVAMICGNAASRGHAARGFFVPAIVTNTSATFVDADADLSPTNFLPKNVMFKEYFNDRQPVVFFTPDGRVWLPNDVIPEIEGLRFTLFIAQGDRVIERYVKIDPLTGIASVVNEKGN